MYASKLGDPLLERVCVTYIEWNVAAKQEQVSKQSQVIGAVHSNRGTYMLVHVNVFKLRNIEKAVIKPVAGLTLS